MRVLVVTLLVTACGLPSAHRGDELGTIPAPERPRMHFPPERETGARPEVETVDRARRPRLHLASHVQAPTVVQPSHPWTAAVAAPVAGPVRYGLKPEQSWLAVVVRTDRSSPAAYLGHDHVVRAADFFGTVRWDVEDPTACEVRIAFPVTSLAVDPPGARARAGLPGETDPDIRGRITADMLGAMQLDAGRHRQIAFRSTRCDGVGEAVRVEGLLAIRGVEVPVAADLAVTADGDAFHARGDFSLRHAEMGIVPFAALAGSLRNEDLLAFQVEVRGAAE